MSSERVDQRLEAALGADVETLRQDGWRPPHEQERQLPRITALAAWDPDSTDAYALVNWAIGKLGRGGERTDAARALFGIAEKRRQTVKQRNEAAAPCLGYSTGDSFRKSGEDRSLCRELTDQLVKRAGTCGFVLDDETVGTQAALSASPEPCPVGPVLARPTKLGHGQKRRRARLRVLTLAVCMFPLLLLGPPQLASDVSSRLHAMTPSISQLAKATAQELDGSRAPSPYKSMTSQLGFGDPTSGGRTVFHYDPDGFLTTFTPTFDSIGNAPYGIGDERRFLRVAVSPVTDARQIALPKLHVASAQPGDIVWMTVRIDNNAAETADCRQPVGRTVARATHLKLVVWNSPDNRVHVIRAWLLSSTTKPPWITDAVAVLTANRATLEPDNKLSRQYVYTSRRFSHAPLVDVDTALDPAGMVVGDNGVVGSCWRNIAFLRIALRQH